METPVVQIATGGMISSTVTVVVHEAMLPLLSVTSRVTVLLPILLQSKAVGATLKVAIPQLSLDVYYKLGKEKSYVYEDAQDGYDYNKGRFSYKTFTLIGKEKELIIIQHKEGNYETLYSTIKHVDPLVAGLLKPFTELSQ
mgnify:CR=1 FL=1